MEREQGGDREGGGGGGRFFQRRRPCRFCIDKGRSILNMSGC